MTGPAVEAVAPRQYAAWRDGRVPPVEEITGGLWSIPVPMPGSLHYTLVYALELPEGVGLVDAGWPASAAWEALAGGLAQAGFRPADVRALLVTHAHPDHYGLARRVREASGAWVGLHRADMVLPAGRGDHTRSDLGMPEPSAAEAAALRRSRDRVAAQLSSPDVLIEHGARLDLPGWDLRAMWTPGHSAGHLCFHEPGRHVLFAGDHILPGISPQVPAPAGGGDPLGDYLGSLRQVSDLGEVTVLPAHEFRYTGLAGRARELVGHHDSRLAQIASLLSRSPGMTCWEITHAVTWSRPMSGARMRVRRKAAQETLAHLVHLESRRLAHRTAGPPQRWLAGPSDPAANPRSPRQRRDQGGGA